MKLNRRNILVFLASALGFLLLWRVLAGIDFAGLRSTLEGISRWKIAAVALMPFVSFAIAAFRLGLLLRLVSGQRIPFFKLCGITFAGAAISLIVPSASMSGDVAKGVLLARAGAKRPQAFAAVAIDSFGRFLANTGMSFLLVVGAVLAVPMLRGTALMSMITIWILGGVLILGILFRSIFHQSGRAVSFIERFIPNHAQDSDLREFDVILTGALRTFQLPAIAIAISIVGFLWELAQTWLVLRFLGIGVAFFALLSWYAFVTFPHIIPVAAGLGFVEAAGVFVAELFGVPAVLGAGFVALTRLRDLTILSVGAITLLIDRLRAHQNRRLSEK